MPAYDLSDHAIGIDISDGSLELANIHRRSDTTLAIQDIARIKLDDASIVHGVIKKNRSLAHSLKKLLAHLKLNEGASVVSALPDAQVIMKTIEFERPPAVTHKYIVNLVRDTIERAGIRVPDPRYAWRIAGSEAGMTRLHAFVTAGSHVRQWQSVFKRCGLNLLVLEMESLALARALEPHMRPGERYGILDLGFRAANLSIFNQSGLQFSHALFKGGLHVTHAIAHTLNISPAEAELIKRSNGVNGKNETAKRAITEYMNETSSSVKEIITARGNAVDALLLTGGGATIAGADALLAQQLRVSVRRGEIMPASSAQKVMLDLRELSTDDQQIFAGAIGLALRGLDRASILRGINFIE